MELPKFQHLKGRHDYDDKSLVAVADYKLCYLWCDGSYDNWMRVHLATVVVSCDGSFATVSENRLDVNAKELISCIPFDSCSYENEEISEESVEIVDDEEHIQMCDCCENLKDDIQKLKEDISRC